MEVNINTGTGTCKSSGTTCKAVVTCLQAEGLMHKANGIASTWIVSISQSRWHELQTVEVFGHSVVIKMKMNISLLCERGRSYLDVESLNDPSMGISTTKVSEIGAIFENFDIRVVTGIV